MKTAIAIVMTLTLAMVSLRAATAAGPDPVNLGSTSHFAILSGAAITSTGGGIINGDIGASPIAGSAIGIPPVQVNGTIYEVDATGTAGPNVVIDPTLLTAAKGDLTIAYNDAAGRTPVPSGSFLNPNDGNIGGLNLAPGLYKFTTTALITGSDVTLTGGPDDVWIFQCAQDLQLGSGRQVILAGGALAKNIFWQVGTSAVLGTSSIFKGTILADQSITMMSTSTMEGRALAFSGQVAFDGTGGTLPAFNLTVTGGTGSGQYPAGALVPVIATIPVGQVFDAWNGDTQYLGDPASASTIVTMPLNDVAVTATFIDAPPETFTLTVVNGTGGGAYLPGATVPVVAVIPVGQVFDTWAGDIAYLADATFASTIATMPAANILVTAIFKDAPPSTYTLTVVNGTGGGAYASETVVPIVAVVPAGQVFSAWTGDTIYLADPTAASTTATMPEANIVVTATFTEAPPETFTLTVVNGTVGGAYVATTIVPIIAVVPAGKVFEMWAGDILYVADPTSASTTVTMPDANITVSAIFTDMLGDGDMFLAEMDCTINWASHAKNVDGDSLSVSGRINPRGANHNLSGATVTLIVNDVQLIPAVPLGTRGSARGHVAYTVQFDWLSGAYSFIVRGLDLRAATGAPNVTGRTLLNLPMSLSIQTAGLDIPLVAGTFECPCATTAGKASRITFNNKSNRTLTGLYLCTTTLVQQQGNAEPGAQAARSGAVHNIKVEGVIETLGGGAVNPTGDITVKLGDATLLIPFEQMSERGSVWSYKGAGPGITGFSLDNGKHTFSLSASKVEDTGIPLTGQGAPKSYRLDIQLQMQTEGGAMGFDSTVEILRPFSSDWTWRR